MSDGYRVLLIEDSDVDAMIFARSLQGLDGWQVERVASLGEAEELVERLGRPRFDLVAVDLSLPDAFDLEAVHFARDQFPDAACVVVTSAEEPHLDERALRSGASDLVLKGNVSPAAVQRTVSYAVERNELIRQQLQSERNLRSLMAAWVDGVFVLDAEGALRFHNDAAEAFLPAVQGGARAALDVGPGDVLRTELPRDGASVPVEVTGRAMTWDGRPATLVVVRDRSAEREAERAVSRVRQSERLARAGEASLAGLHDIGNAVTALRDGLERLSDAVDDPDAVLWVRRLSEQADHIGAVARRGRDAAAEMRDVRLQLDLPGLVRACCDSLRVAADDIDLRLQLRDAPPVLGDGVALRRVVENLLTNAVEAMRGTSGPRELRVSVRGTTASVTLEVEDSGPGIDPAHLPRIFERHYTTKGEGTGLGLATVREVVEAHGGHLEVKSSPGAGAVFRIRLPALVAVPEPARSALRVLLVEDRPEVARANRRLLGTTYEVEVASDGREALRVLSDHGPFDVVLCDLQMPGMDGGEFVRHLEAHDAGASRRVVFVSGGVTSAALEAFVRRSGRPLLHKPLDPAETFAVIEAVAAAAERATA